MLKNLKKLAEKQYLLAQFEMARQLMNWNMEPDPTAALDWLKSVMRKGPWTRLAKTAEELWNDRNHRAAVLIWMELAECGVDVAAFNAGLALLELNLGELVEDEQRKLQLAVDMLRLAKDLGMSGNDTFPYIFRALCKSGLVEEGVAMLTQMAKSPLAYFYIAHAHLDGQIRFSIRKFWENASRAITCNAAFVVSLLVLAPQIMWAVVSLGVDAAIGSADPAEVQGLKDAIKWFAKTFINEILLLIVSIFLIPLLIERAKRMRPSAL
jgi:hypothetical protein